MSAPDDEFIDADNILHAGDEAALVKNGGGDSSLVSPTIGELKIALATNPKPFEKKSGELKDTRAAKV
jgi:hypothetical protein